jgi:hypothetical protein
MITCYKKKTKSVITEREQQQLHQPYLEPDQKRDASPAPDAVESIDDA